MWWSGPGLTGHALIAWMETLTKLLCEVLSGVISDTKAFVVKKQTMTLAERLAEAEAEAEVEDEDEDEEAGSDDEVKAIYNPKNLPLGWDGKPIPYWLYKLHGLGVEFVCEICGGMSYWGRRQFDRHFQVRGRHWCLVTVGR